MFGVGLLVVLGAVALVRQGGGVFLDFLEGLRRRLHIERLLLGFSRDFLFLHYVGLRLLVKIAYLLRLLLSQVRWNELLSIDIPDCLVVGRNILSPGLSFLVDNQLLLGYRWLRAA